MTPAPGYNARMSEKSKPRWVFDGVFAVSCEFDEAKQSFDFLLEDGSHEVASFPDAKPEELEKFIADNRKYVPIVRKGERENP